MRRLGWLLFLLLIPAFAAATGSLTIPQTIFTQPGGTNVAPLLDQNYTAIANYINTREVSFGLLAARPAAGTAGRYYFATDQVIFYADNGTSWTQLSPAVSGQLVSQRASLTLANNGSATASFLVFPGAVTSDDTTIASRVIMTLTASLTKRPGTAWAVGSGNGCLDAGAAAAFTFYHVFLIQRTDTGVVDVLCSISATAPTMPTNYTKKQRLGAIRTTWAAAAGSEIYFFAQVKNRFRWASTAASNHDVANATPGAGTTNVATLSVPNGVITKALIACTVANTSQLYISELNASDEAPAGPISCGSFGGTAGGYVEVMADPSQRIRYKNSANVATDLFTLGYEEQWD